MAIRGLLLDMDGVLYNANTPIAGAVETIAWAAKRKIPFLFVTNTSSRGRGELAAKLGRMGIEADESQILTPSFATAQWLREQPANPIALFVLRATAHAEFAEFTQVDQQAESGARFVIVGDLGAQWNFPTLNRAFRLLQNGAELIALGMTKYWQAEDGLRLDVAPFVAALECASGKAAHVFGKPAKLFFEAAARQLQLPLHELVMLGDDVEVDVGGAMAAGARGMLVKTGKYRPPDLEKAADAIIESIAALPDWWEKNSNA
jgi:HAD superfamily hydrolase (TIGR01458 family)